jgi:nucleotide-binding universal stress UspA family protein
MNPSRRARRVVVGVHDSPNSMAALRRAVVEARKRQTELDIVFVIPEDSDASDMAIADQKLSDLVAGAFPAGLDVPHRLLIELGDPAMKLVQLCAGAELLIIGAQSNSDRRGIFGGEIVQVCLRNAQCPVDICAHHGEGDAAYKPGLRN